MARFARAVQRSIVALVVLTSVGVANAATAGLGGSGSLAGLVTNASTGAPVAGACVAAVQSNAVVTTATTASDGRYTVSNLAPGDYQVMTCLTTTTLANGRARAAVIIKAGRTASVATIALTTGYSISGTVFAAAPYGPVPGACVEVFDSTFSYTGTPPATTDPNGVFQLTNLAPGAYTLTTCLGPSSPYANQTASLTVSPTVPTAGIALSLPLGGSLSGVVTDGSAKAPIKGVEVIADAQGERITSDVLMPVRSDADGQYTITNLAPGPYSIVAGEQGSYSFTHAATATVRAGATVSANLVGTALGRIAGTVVNSVTGRPVARVCLRVSREGGSAGVTIYPATTAANGSFIVTGLPPGRYRFTTCVTPRGYKPFRSTTTVAVAGLRTTTGVRLRLMPTGH